MNGYEYTKVTEDGKSFLRINHEFFDGIILILNQEDEARYFYHSAVLHKKYGYTKEKFRKAHGLGQMPDESLQLKISTQFI